jgi:hypothetical protein
MNVTWHLIPMAFVISLVYNASRYELPEKILRRSARWFVTILLFMGAIFCLLLVLSFGL